MRTTAKRHVRAGIDVLKIGDDEVRIVAPEGVRVTVDVKSDRHVACHRDEIEDVATGESHPSPD